VGAKYLKDGAWSSLGSDVASSSSVYGDVGISFYNNDIRVTYLSGSEGKLLVKTHAAAKNDSAGNDNNGGSGNNNGGTGNNNGGSGSDNSGSGNNNSGGTVQTPATPTTPSMPSDSDEPTVEGKAYWYTKDGVVYCYMNNKSLQKGWKTVNKRRYYFDKKTGAMQTGFCTLSKKTYYLGQDGVLCTGVFRVEDGGTCYADKKGVLKSGWQKIANSWRYFDTTSWKEDAAASVGADYFATATENGEKHTYYFVKGKSLAKGWKKIDGSRYYFDKTGVMQTGKIKIGRAYYLLDADGRAHTGFVQEDGHTYYYDKNGKMATGKKTIDKQKYVFGKDGVLQGT
jgi:glucan-binding YG repeat protein